MSTVETATIYPSVFPRMAAERYHSLPQLSRGQIVDFMESPQLYYRRHILKDSVWQQKPSKEMEFGTYCHKAILEDKDATKGWKFYPPEVLSSNGGRGTNACRAFEAANKGTALFKEGEEKEWLAMWDSIQRCPDARRLLLDDHEGSLEEVTVLWEHKGMGCRCRLDRILGDEVGDLKTCHSGEINKLRGEIERRKLYIQACWYLWGVAETMDRACNFVFVFVEKKAPFRTTCVDLDEKWRRAGMDEIQQALERLQKRADSGNWNDPCNDQIFTLSRPTWTDYALQITEE